MNLLFYIFALLALVGADPSCSRPAFVATNSRSFLSTEPSTRPSLAAETALSIRGGTWFIPAGWHPFGYKITKLGEEFLSFDGSSDSDIGRFISALKVKRVRKSTLRDAWVEIVRASKTGQNMRILRKFEDLIKFCLDAGLID